MQRNPCRAALLALCAAMALGAPACYQFEAERASGDPLSIEGFVQNALIAELFNSALNTPAFWFDFSRPVPASDGGPPIFLAAAGFLGTGDAQLRYYMYREPVTAAPQVMRLSFFDGSVDGTADFVLFFTGSVRDTIADRLVFTRCSDSPCAPGNAEMLYGDNFAAGTDPTLQPIALPSPVGATNDNYLLPQLTTSDATNGALFNTWDGTVENEFYMQDVSSGSPTAVMGGGGCRDKQRYRGFAVCSTSAPQYYDPSMNMNTGWSFGAPANSIAPFFVERTAQNRAYIFADNGGSLELYRTNDDPNGAGAFTQITPVPGVAVGSIFGVEARAFVLGGGNHAIVWTFFDANGFETPRVWFSTDNGASYSAGSLPGDADQQSRMLPRDFYVDANGELRIIQIPLTGTTNELITFSSFDGSNWTAETRFTPPTPDF